MKRLFLLVILVLVMNVLMAGSPVCAESAQMWYNKGNDLANLGKYEEAIEAYDQALKIDPEYVKAWYNKGSSLAILERDEEAIKAYDQALKYDPEKVDAWYNKGNSFYNLGKYEEAIDVYDQVLKIDPEYINAWTNKGNSLYVLGRSDDAIEAYNQALKIDSENTYAQDGMKNLLNNQSSSDKTGSLKEEKEQKPVSTVIQYPSKSPGMKITASNKDDGIHITGTFGGLEQDKSILVWIIGDDTRRVEEVQVSDPEDFSYVIPWDYSKELSKKSVYILIQHPSDNGQFDLFPDNPMVPLNILYPSKKARGDILLQFKGTGSFSKQEVVDKMVQTLSAHDTPRIDDIYVYFQTKPDEPGGSIIQCGSWGDYCQPGTNDVDMSGVTINPALKEDSEDDSSSASVPYDKLIRDYELYKGKEYTISGMIAKVVDTTPQVKAKGLGTDGQTVTLVGSFENSNGDRTEFFDLVFIDKPLGKRVGLGDEITVTVQGAGIITYKEGDGEDSTIPCAFVKSGQFN